MILGWYSAQAQNEEHVIISCTNGLIGGRLIAEDENSMTIRAAGCNQTIFRSNINYFTSSAKRQTTSNNSPSPTSKASTVNSSKPVTPTPAPSRPKQIKPLDMPNVKARRH